MLEHDVPGQCRDKGALLKKGLEDMAAKYPTVVKEVRGVGMMLAVEVLLRRDRVRVLQGDVQS